MNLQVSPTTLLLSFLLVIVGIVIAQRERLGTAKEIIYSISRAIIQLVIVGYILTFLFGFNSPIVTIGMVAVIGFNAAYNAHKRSQGMAKSLQISMIAVFTTLALTLIILIFSGSILFTPSQVVPISGMIAGNAMTTIGLCYRNLNTLFRDQRQQILEKLSLGATPSQASHTILREAIKSGMQPTLDNAKTIGIVSLPGMMSGLIFAGVVPTTAIMYQIMVTFMLVATTSLASYIASFLAYTSFFNDRDQFIL
ncbi:MAG TPA: iron export ABC transporter permease subunit FetB [Bavariicoccus seileri]|uniref:Iron export ABC transporter permease subunit FetB n=1 Tax=Bavariicoccus seileri TaxID=549685 RepID=A0A3D4S534_9ENTE|nr:iron export ABC transporter permease subunit FetB [Bavariicoccus seileri]HCS93917.1 iron export ABC transporter permease subunit FetB [Bavariicoccus seileri]